MSDDTMLSNINLLVLGQGLGKPASLLFQKKYTMLSHHFSGDIVFSIGRGQEHRAMKKVGNFRIHSFPFYRGNAIIRNLYSFLVMTTKALKIFLLGRKYQVIISPNPLFTGLTALFISRVTKAKVVVEVNGNFEEAFKFGSSGNVNLIDKLKHHCSKHLIPFVLRHADSIRLLYKDQLDPLRIDELDPNKIGHFSDFVPTSLFFNRQNVDRKYILLIGFPWFLKGVDILIKAFNRMSSEFPGYRLKIVGWCPEGKSYYEELSANNPAIELCDPVQYEEVPKLMSQCSVYVLASRTEAMGRVLIEAMASAKPIIAARVGGVPEIIKDGFNGLLFERENVDELARKIRMVLSDQDLAMQLAQNGYHYMKENLSELNYLENYKNMIESLVFST